MAQFRPLLSAKAETEEDLEKLRYPLLVSPKIDGIRCVIHPELGPVTRSLKPIPNEYTRRLLTNSMLPGADGELVVGDHVGENAFNMTTRGIMSHGGEPDFTFLIFDNYLLQDPFTERLRSIETFCIPNYMKRVTHFKVNTAQELLAYEEVFIKDGYEGIMIRDPNGKYKFNRSTFKEQILIKFKRTEEDEARIIGFEEKMHNANEAQKNALGYTERSDHQSGWVPAGTLGALIVENPKWGTFKIGSGFDDAFRSRIWASRDRYKGKLVTFKFQRVGIQEKPRFPIFKGFREDL